MEIDAETMLERVSQKTQKTIQHRVQLNTNNIKKALQNRRWKTIVKGSGKKHPGQFLDSKSRPSREGGGGHDGAFYFIVLN